MRKNITVLFNLLICVLMIVTVIYTYKSFGTLYSIEYSDSSKNEIYNLLLRNNIQIPNCKSIIKVTMERVIPNGYYYTVYYTDSHSNTIQLKSFSRESESIFRDYILKYGNNISNKYRNVAKIVFLVLLFIVLLKYFLIRSINK